MSAIQFMCVVTLLYLMNAIVFDYFRIKNLKQKKIKMQSLEKYFQNYDSMTR